MSKPTANQIAATLRCCSDSNSELLCIDCAFSVGVSCLKNNCYDAAADMLEEQEARIRELEAQVDAERWHDLLENPEDLPEEHDSIFAKFYGTDKFIDGAMFRKTSYPVIAAFSNSKGEVISAEAHTIDGKWKVTRGISMLNELTVIAWRPMPKPPKEVAHE